MEKKNIDKMIPLLICWYQKNRRDLPWRKNKEPYQIWVSEIMLQQTRVETVIPYFERFIKKLPTLDHLSQIEEDELLKLWEGLGYYSRVKNMQKCAKKLIEKNMHTLPSTYQELIKLPGIGPYTAGAIASIAFEEKVSAVDGNVLRVISRFLSIHQNISNPKVKKEIELLLNEHMPHESGTFNQALMELGATICIPGNPRCNVCPLQKLCKAYEKGEMYILPIKEKKKKQKDVYITVFLLFYKNKFAIQKRKDTGLLASLFEFPNIEESISTKKIPFSFDKVKETTLYKHTFTHQIWYMKGYILYLNEMPKENFTWVSLQELEENYSLPTAFKYFIKDIKHIEKKLF